MFDGPPERGMRSERIATGLVVRYSGGRTADAVILTIVDDVRMLDGADGSAALLVVTDDRDLRHGARLRGARTAGAAWLLGRLEPGGWPRRRSAIPGPRTVARPGHGRPARQDGDHGDETDRARLETRSRRDDEERQPAQGAETGGTDRMRP